MTTITGWILAFVLASSMVPAGSTAAGPSLVKKAKDLGYPAQNCRYCHATAVPKKETYTAEELNDRGRWLLNERQRRQAGQVEASWLKDYPGGKEP